MKLKNDALNSLFFYSKIGRKISKQNLILYRWILKKKFNRPQSVSPSIEKIKFLYNIKKLRFKKDEEDNEEEIDIFSIEEKERQKLEEFEDQIEERKIFQKKLKLKEEEEEKDKDTKKKTMEFKSHRYNFIKKKENKNKVQPSSTKYNPKYDAILRRSISSPSWKFMQGRKNKIKIDNYPFYLKQDSIQNNMAGKSFIDFSKQTPRNKNAFDKEDAEIYDIGQITRNKSVINNKRQKHRNIRNQTPLVRSESKSSKNISKSKRSVSTTKRHQNKNNLSNSSDSSKSNDSFDLFKHLYSYKIKKKRNKEKGYSKNKEKIKSIDFNQIISREALEESKNKEIAVVPYLFPNFSFVRERPQMMVVYDRKVHKKYKRKSDLDSMEFNTINYEKNKKQVQVPNFNLMNSRPYDENDPYPSYMRGVFNKSATFKISSESLKANSYTKRGFIMPLSSFWNNNSFNKYINLKMLKSQSHLMKAFIRSKNIEPKYKRLLKFYNKNYKVLMEGKTKYSRLDNDINVHMKKHQNKSIKDLIKELKKND